MQDLERQLAEAREAKEKAKEIFPHFGSVNGIGLAKQGDGYAVKVSFEAEPRNREGMPREIGGIPVIVRIIGQIHKHVV
jgi:hypothetical protein